MRSNKAFLSVRRMYAGPTVIRSVGKYLRYIHYRDQIQRGEEGRGVAGLLRYTAYREQASPEGRLFTRNRNIGDQERQALLRFVRRSLVGLPAHQLNGRRGHLPAAYRFVFSPEDARGLDLRKLTREIMGQLEQDAGDLPPWIAAEHRNTGHPHIHILMAARREIAPGEFRGIEVTKERLARMKERTGRGIEAQRENRLQSARPLPEMPGISRTAIFRPARGRSRSQERAHTRVEVARDDPLRRSHRRTRPHRLPALSWYPIQNAFARVAAHNRKALEREEERMRRRGLSARDAGEEREWEVYE